MSDAVASAIQFAINGKDVPAEVMQSAISQVMEGAADERLLAALLTALRINGEAVSEIVGAARAMVAYATKIPTHRKGLLDTCGTGGDGLCTFNISTAAAIVAAAAGVPVAKHGNRSVSSSSGSADVLEALGVNVQLSPEVVGRCVDEIGIGFCFAPLCHGSMKHAMPVRKLLGFRTLFNLLGPLTNPAGAEFQLLGVSSLATAEKIAKALAQLNRKRAFVVCGAGELDEVSLWGETTVYLIEEGRVFEETWTSQSTGLPECRVEDLRVKSAEESANVIREILNGIPGPARDMVAANAAAALFAAEKVKSLEEGVTLAHDAIDEGRAADLLEQLKRFTNAKGAG